jgi:hypothetical protein
MRDHSFARPTREVAAKEPKLGSFMHGCMLYALLVDALPWREYAVAEVIEYSTRSQLRGRAVLWQQKITTAVVGAVDEFDQRVIRCNAFQWLLMSFRISGT